LQTVDSFYPLQVGYKRRRNAVSWVLNDYVGFSPTKKEKKEKKRKGKKETKKERKKLKRESKQEVKRKKERIFSPPVAGAKPEKHPKTFERLNFRCLCVSRSHCLSHDLGLLAEKSLEADTDTDSCVIHSRALGWLRLEGSFK